MDATVPRLIVFFTSIVWEAFPFVVLGALIAGFLEEFVPQQFIAKLVPRTIFGNQTLAIAVAIPIGGALGLIFPMCECGIVPVMRRLLRKGLPLGTCLAYMLAGPIINLVVIMSTWVAFENHGIAPQMVLLRCLMGFVIACSTAAFVEIFLVPRHGMAGLLTKVALPPSERSKGVEPPIDATHPAEVNLKSPPKNFFQRLGNVSQTALHDFIDIMVFLCLGAALASVAKLFISPQTVSDISTQMPMVAILCMMGLAFLLSLCSEADAFVAASFTTLHPSAKLAFLVYGPMLDVKLLFLFTRVFRPRLILMLVVSVTTLSFLASVAVHYIWEAMDWYTAITVVN